MKPYGNSGVLLMGFILLCVGPLLIRLAPALPPQDNTSPWRIPDTKPVETLPGAPTLRGVVTGLSLSEERIIERDSRAFRFQRFSHSVRAMDEDLVPWFTQGSRGWIREKRYTDGRNDRIQVTRLERFSGTGGGVSVQAFRVGPYVASGFNTAKLLQIPAKLRGFSTMEMVLLNAECRRDCNEVADTAVRMLDQILEANTCE